MLAAHFNPARFFLVAVPLSLALSLLLTFGWLNLFARFRRRMLLRRFRDLESSIWKQDLDAARAMVEGWENKTRRKDIYPRLYIARAWALIGDHERSLRILDGTTVPKRRLYRILRSEADELRYEALQALGQEGKAAWLLNDAVDRDPTAPWLVAARVRVARASGEPSHLEAALDHARRVATEDPRNLRAAFALVSVVTEQHRFAEGADLLERILTQTDINVRKHRVMLPHNTYELVVALGTMRLAAGGEAEAEEAFTEALSRAPDPTAAAAKIVRARADGLFHARRFEDAANIYEAILAEAPDAPLCLFLAECRHRQGDFAAAWDALARARELDPGVEGGRLLEARLLSDEGRAREAEKIALEVTGGEDTTDPLSLYTITYVRATGHLPGAEETLRRYVRMQPYDPDLGPLLDRPAPGGGTWRDRVEVALRPDV